MDTDLTVDSIFCNGVNHLQFLAFSGLWKYTGLFSRRNYTLKEI